MINIYKLLIVILVLSSCDNSIKHSESQDMLITEYYGDDDILDSTISIDKRNKDKYKYERIKDSFFIIRIYDSLGVLRVRNDVIEVSKKGKYMGLGLRSDFYTNGKVEFVRYLIRDIDNPQLSRISTCDYYTEEGKYLIAHSFRVYKKKDSMLDVNLYSKINVNKYLYVKNDNKIDSFLSISKNHWKIDIKKLPKLNEDAYFYVKNYNLDALKKYTTVDSKISIFKLNEEYKDVLVYDE